MSDPIIKVENLSKRYRIGLQEKKADTFAQQVWNSFKAPVENFKRIRSLGKFNEASDSVHWALKDVSFEVKQGEVLGIIGKNGAGKSTLLKILSKITEPTSGRIAMNGRVAALLEVGTGFHPELTGRENIYMNGTILGMSKKEIDHKLDEIIDFSGIETYVDTPVKFYSSGMRVRLGFSVAAHLEPEILVIDEVLAVGDYEFQQKCLGKMEDVSKKEGRTVLFVSHNMAMMKNLCSAGLLLKSGVVEFSGGIVETVDNYLREVQSESIQMVFNTDTNKDIFFQSVEMEGEFMTGSSVKFQFKINNQLNERSAELAVTFTLLDGTPVLQYYSGHVGKIFSLSNGVNSLEMKIDNLPLSTGFYFMNLWLGSKGTSFDFYSKFRKVKIKEGRIIKDGPVCTYNKYPVINAAVWQ